MNEYAKKDISEFEKEIKTKITELITEKEKAEQKLEDFSSIYEIENLKENFPDDEDFAQSVHLRLQDNYFKSYKKIKSHLEKLKKNPEYYVPCCHEEYLKKIKYVITEGITSEFKETYDRIKIKINDNKLTANKGGTTENIEGPNNNVIIQDDTNHINYNIKYKSNNPLKIIIIKEYQNKPTPIAHDELIGMLSDNDTKISEDSGIQLNQHTKKIGFYILLNLQYRQNEYKFIFKNHEKDKKKFKYLSELRLNKAVEDFNNFKRILDYYIMELKTYTDILNRLSPENILNNTTKVVTQEAAAAVAAEPVVEPLNIFNFGSNTNESHQNGITIKAPNDNKFNFIGGKKIKLNKIRRNSRKRNTRKRNTRKRSTRKRRSRNSEKEEVETQEKEIQKRKYKK